jgi:hypothetical protein
MLVPLIVLCKVGRGQDENTLTPGRSGGTAHIAPRPSPAMRAGRTGWKRLPPVTRHQDGPSTGSITNQGIAAGQHTQKMLNGRRLLRKLDVMQNTSRISSSAC